MAETFPLKHKIDGNCFPCRYIKVGKHFCIYYVITALENNGKLKVGGISAVMHVNYCKCLFFTFASVFDFDS